ncbi:hypothetical protein AURDEDRAFT_154513 [Auricularia subglabra TFB-10046 SS5]|nr:hypothetical protein AURDEDRAFT_154513 [Auricularia subglabra TFB-10046 SS5]
MRPSFAPLLLAAVGALGAPQFTTDSNLEQFPTVIDPTRSSLFPDPTFTIPRPPGEGPFPSSTPSVTFPVEPRPTPSATNSDSNSIPTTTDTDTDSESSTASQSLPTNPSGPTTPLPEPTGAAQSVHMQSGVLAAAVAALFAALL